MQEARNIYTMYLSEAAEEGAVETNVWVEVETGKWVEIENGAVTQQGDKWYVAAPVCEKTGEHTHADPITGCFELISGTTNVYKAK